MQTYLITKSLNEVVLLFEQIQHLISISNTQLIWEGQARKNYDNKVEEIKINTQVFNNYINDLEYEFAQIKEGKSE